VTSTELLEKTSGAITLLWLLYCVITFPWYWAVLFILSGTVLGDVVETTIEAVIKERQRIAHITEERRKIKCL
jgi:hypothetical protein